MSHFGETLKMFLIVTLNTWKLFIPCVMSTLISHKVSIKWFTFRYLNLVLNGKYCLQIQSLSDAIYGTNWADYNLSPRLKTAMMMFMQRSQKGQKFVAGKIFVVNISNFVKV